MSPSMPIAPRFPQATLPLKGERYLNISFKYVVIQGDLGGFLLRIHIVNEASTLVIVVVLDVAEQSSF